ncbi:hypothetical protein Trydic_g1919 [Trypoxylus dichotomus]
MQFQPQFQVTINFGILVGFISSLVDMVYVLANGRVDYGSTRSYFSQGLYIFDAFYLIELVLMVIYKNITCPEIKYIYPPRNGFILIMEAATLLPTELSFSDVHRSYFITRLRYAVRIIRMLLYIRAKSKRCDIVGIVMLMFNLLIVYFLVSMTASFIIIPVLSLNYRKYVTDQGFLTFIYAITSKITAKGYGMAFGENKIFDYSLCILTVIAFLMSSYFTSKIACSLIPWIKQRFSFAHNYMRIDEYLHYWCTNAVIRRSNLFRCYERTFLRYFQISLNYTKSYIHKEIPKGKIPHSIIKEVSLDLFWPAFKHSHLFRNQEVPFLRSLSQKMDYRFFLPGEPLCRKDIPKSRMMYVVSGIIQIISEENSETPILSLSGGTCFGETTIFVDYPSTYTLISKTYSETIVLERKQFIKMYKIYPRVCRNLAKKVAQRYRKAREYRAIREYQQHQYKKIVGTIEDPSIIYIQTTLKRMLYDETCSGKHSQKTTGILRNFCFCADYLDLLCITEKLELITDSFFIKRDFPFIFQPDSIVIKTWDLFIGIVATCLVVVYPMIVCATSIEEKEVAFKYFMCVITLLWSVDIYLKISTAVKEQDLFLTKISKIVYYRLSTVNFIVDLVCVFPIGLVMSVIYLGLDLRIMVLLECHKLLKVYRMHNFIGKFGHLNSTTLIVMKYLKVTVYSFLLMYYSACTLYLMLCSGRCHALYLSKLKLYYEIKEDDTLLIFLQLYAVSSYFINDVEVFEVFPLLGSRQVIITIFLQIIYACVYIYLLADTIATDTVNQQEKHEFKEFASDMDIIMKKFRFQSNRQKSVWNFLMHHYSLDMGITFLNPEINQSVLSSNLFDLHQFVLYGRQVTSIPLFTSLDDKIISDICEMVNAVVYSPNQVITYAGEICKEMHFIAYGQCKRIDKQGHVTILKANDHFSVFEMSAGILTVHTVISITDCSVLSISTGNYNRLVDKYRCLKRDIDMTVNYMKTNRNFYLYANDDPIIYMEIIPTDVVEKQKNYYFLNAQKKKSNKLTLRLVHGWWSCFLQCFLMRITFTSYGKFLFKYEAFRSVLALATNFLCSSVVIVDETSFFYTLLTFDILSWIDLYMMHHVCYFNRAGLEVSHPVFTAKHYWTHSFLIDLIACVPIDYPFPVKSRVGYRLRLNRCLQIRRILAFFNFLNANNISRTGAHDILKYFPLCALIINYVALFFLESNCYIDILTRDDDECACRYLVKRKMSNITFTPMNMQAASLLFISSTLAMIGMTRFYLKTFTEMIFLTVLVLFAVVFSIWLTAKMVANNFYRNSDLTTYQQAVKELLLFFSYRKVDKNIKKEIINHYEHVWQMKRCKDLHHMTSYFNTCFKEDLLYDIFGEAIRTSELFPGADKSFYKSLLLEMEHIVLLKRAIIYRVNDIHNRIYFLLQGQVEVLGADFKKLLVLNSGSLFGSLDNCPFMRQTLMMIAKTNLELLCVANDRFHAVLSQYHRLHLHYLHLTAMHNDYIVRQRCTSDHKRYSHSQTQMGYESAFMRLYARLNPIYKRNSMLRIWEFFVLFTTGFVGFHIELFQKITWDKSMWIIIVLYGLDFLHLMKIYLKFHTAYTNRIGVTVTSRKKIAEHYIKSKLEFYTDVLSTIPLDALTWSVTNPTIKLVAFSCCRLNRTIRIILVCNVLKSALEKLYINVVAMRMLFIGVLLSMYIHILSGFLVFIRFLLRVYTPNYYDRLDIYESTVLVVLYTAMGNSINNFTITFTLMIVAYCVLLTIMGRFIITLFIAETCAIMESVNKNKNTYKVLSSRVLTFIKAKFVSEPLQKEVKNYMRLMWVFHQGVHFPQLLENAPYYLREAALNAMFGCHIRKHPVLGNLHIDLIRQMAAEMRLVILFPGNTVVNKGDIDHCMYFIHQGTVDALSEDSLDSEVIEHTLEAGDSFGLVQGVHPRYGHDYTYKVRKHAILIRLKRKKWFFMLSLFPASEEIMSDYLSSQITEFEYE